MRNRTVVHDGTYYLECKMTLVNLRIVEQTIWYAAKKTTIVVVCKEIVNISQLSLNYCTILVGVRYPKAHVSPIIFII